MKLYLREYSLYIDLYKEIICHQYTVSILKNYQFLDVIMCEPLVVKTMIQCTKSHSFEINSMGDVTVLLSYVSPMSMLVITGVNI